MKYVRAIFQALPFFGSIHLGVLLSVAYLRGSWDELNFFHFLDIHLLYPSIGEGIWMFFGSWIFFGLSVVGVSFWLRRITHARHR
ncbi:MAG: hypothetical protein AAB800_02960 [Patescibacteria group bacterium]